MKISENEVRDCFLKCGNKNPNGLYHGEGDDALDLLEFAQYVADYVSNEEYRRGARNEHKRCVELVSKLNINVGNFLLDKKEYAE